MTLSREKYLARAQAEVDRAREKLKHYAGDCEDCRWQKGGWWSEIMMTGPLCGHPASIAAAFNVTDAYAREHFQFCEYQRDDDDIWGPVLCGPNGALFEER